jgi:hypothetical protein
LVFRPDPEGVKRVLGCCGEPRRSCGVEAEPWSTDAPPPRVDIIVFCWYIICCSRLGNVRTGLLVALRLEPPAAIPLGMVVVYTPLAGTTRADPTALLARALVVGDGRMVVCVPAGESIPLSIPPVIGYTRVGDGDIAGVVDVVRGMGRFGDPNGDDSMSYCCSSSHIASILPAAPGDPAEKLAPGFIRGLSTGLSVPPAAAPLDRPIGTIFVFMRRALRRRSRSASFSFNRMRRQRWKTPSGKWLTPEISLCG